MALFTMLRFPLSFAFIIAVQFINMKTSLKRISTFLENPELDPAALEGARRGRPSRELLPTASPSPTIIEVAVERADKAEGSARAPLRAAEVNLPPLCGGVVVLRIDARSSNVRLGRPVGSAVDS